LPTTGTAAIQPMSKRLPLTVHIVISGKGQAVQGAIAVLKAEGIKTKKLNVSMPSTPPLMEPMLEAFERACADVAYHPHAC